MIDFKTGKKNILKAQEEIKTNWQAYGATYLVPEEKKLFIQTDELLRRSGGILLKLSR